MSGARETARDAAREAVVQAIFDAFGEIGQDMQNLALQGGTLYVDGCIDAKALADAAIGAFTRSTGEGWQSFPAQSLDRVIVAGWQPRRGTVAGYWWYYDDMIDENGKPVDHPDALRWHSFPAPPAHPPAPQPDHAKEEQR